LRSSVRAPDGRHLVHTRAVMSSVLSALWSGLAPHVPLLAVTVAAFLLLAAPLPGRGPRMFVGRDPWRSYRFSPRKTVMGRAGGRCEAALLLAWGRCHEVATEVDHVYPWSRGGPTIVSNGQALCRGHNRRKSNLRPPWWYLLALERRRARYFAPGVDVRVHGRMSADERAARMARSGRRGL
jgi:hypothetical protein